MNINDPDLSDKLRSLEEERAAGERARAAEAERVARETAARDLERLRDRTIDELRQQVERQPHSSDIRVGNSTYQVDTRSTSWQNTTVVDPTDATGARTIRLGDLATRIAESRHPDP